MFQHTAARRRLPKSMPQRGKRFAFQHTAARRRLPAGLPSAGMEPRSFNTQPPEGGCARRRNRVHTSHRFNTQPPEGGCEARVWAWGRGEVSTHSRPKAAAREQLRAYAEVLFQHTAARRRLPLLRDRESMPCWFQHTAARRRLLRLRSLTEPIDPVSTHSRPKAAASATSASDDAKITFQHTAARRRLPRLIYTYNRPHKFQHTAARRRLRLGAGGGGACVTVSTHSRPKAAARRVCHDGGGAVFQHTAARRRLQGPGGMGKSTLVVSTHSRPKAAAGHHNRLRRQWLLFQHTAARRRLPPVACAWPFSRWFQHTAARRRLPRRVLHAIARRCFNTQPPEGGCRHLWSDQGCPPAFQHTAARRRLRN